MSAMGRTALALALTAAACRNPEPAPQAADRERGTGCFLSRCDPIDLSGLVRRHPELADAIVLAPDCDKRVGEPAGACEVSVNGPDGQRWHVRAETVMAALCDVWSGHSIWGEIAGRKVSVVRHSDPAVAGKWCRVIVADVMAFAYGDFRQDVRLLPGDEVCIAPKGADEEELACFALSYGCVRRPTDPPDAPIAAGSALHLDVAAERELCMSYVVGPDGFLDVPLIGVVVVGGRTAREVEAEVEARLKRYYPAPGVQVVPVAISRSAGGRQPGSKIPGPLGPIPACLWRDRPAVAVEARGE